MRNIVEHKTLYKYGELTEEAKDKAMNDLIELWMEIIPIDTVSHNSNYYKAYKKCEEMRTPWFFGSYVYEYCKKQLEKELRSLEFLIDGTVYYAEC